MQQRDRGTSVSITVADRSHRVTVEVPNIGADMDGAMTRRSV